MDFNVERIKHSLEECKDVTNSIITQIEDLQLEIKKHRGSVLVAKTSGTSVTTVGTGLTVAGLIMAPFTLGTSLIVSTVGAVTSIGGAATNLVTDLVDKSKKKKYIANIQALSEDQQNSKKTLSDNIEKFAEEVEELMKEGLSRAEAIYAAIRGDHYWIYVDRGTNENDYELLSQQEDDFEWVDNDNSKWQPIRKFCFQAGFKSLKLVKNSRTLATIAGGGKDIATLSGIGVGGSAILNTGSNAASAATATTSGSSNIAAGVGRFLGSAAFRGTMAAVGVVFTTIDIALLVKEWKTKDPTEETVTFVENELQEEIRQLDEILEDINLSLNCKLFCAELSNGINVVGTSPLTVRILWRICSGDVSIARRIYKEVDSRNFSAEKAMSFLDEILSEITVTPLQYFDVRGIVVEKVRDSSGSEESDEDNSEKETLENQTVTDELAEENALRMVCKPEDLFSSCEILDNAIRTNVVDTTILQLYPTIIVKFLKSTLNKTVEEIRNVLEGTEILQDYKHPVSKQVANIVNDELIVYRKFNMGYLNANKWEFRLAFNLLVDTAVKLMGEVLDTYQQELSSSEPKESPHIQLEMIELIEFITNHKSFVDPVAECTWCQNSAQNLGSYNDAVTAINCMLLNLQCKIHLWTAEIYDALGENKSKR